MWITDVDSDRSKYMLNSARSLSQTVSLSIWLIYHYTIIALPHLQRNIKRIDSTLRYETNFHNIYHALEKKRFYVDNILLMLGGYVYSTISTHCDCLFADLFLHSNEVDLIQELLKKSEQKLALSFIFMFLYIDVFHPWIIQFDDYFEPRCSQKISTSCFL